MTEPWKPPVPPPARRTTLLATASSPSSVNNSSPAAAPPPGASTTTAPPSLPVPPRTSSAKKMLLPPPPPPPRRASPQPQLQPARDTAPTATNPPPPPPPVSTSALPSIPPPPPIPRPRSQQQPPPQAADGDHQQQQQQQQQQPPRSYVAPTTAQTSHVTGRSSIIAQTGNQTSTPADVSLSVRKSTVVKTPEQNPLSVPASVIQQHLAAQHSGRVSAVSTGGSGSGGGGKTATTTTTTAATPMPIGTQPKKASQIAPPPPPPPRPVGTTSKIPPPPPPPPAASSANKLPAPKPVCGGATSTSSGTVLSSVGGKRVAPTPIGIVARVLPPGQQQQVAPPPPPPQPTAIIAGSRGSLGGGAPPPPPPLYTSHGLPEYVKVFRPEDKRQQKQQQQAPRPGYPPSGLPKVAAPAAVAAKTARYADAVKQQQQQKTPQKNQSLQAPRRTYTDPTPTRSSAAPPVEYMRKRSRSEGGGDMGGGIEGPSRHQRGHMQTPVPASSGGGGGGGGGGYNKYSNNGAAASSSRAPAASVGKTNTSQLNQPQRSASYPKGKCVLFDTCAMQELSVHDLTRILQDNRVVIPHVVIDELDFQSKQYGTDARKAKLRENSRAVRDWILGILTRAEDDPLRRHLRMQKTDEIVSVSKNNDNAVRDCALFFAKKYDNRVQLIVCTNDKFLKLKIIGELQAYDCEVYHSDDLTSWSSRAPKA